MSMHSRQIPHLTGGEGGIGQGKEREIWEGDIR